MTHLFDTAISKRQHLLDSNTNALRLIDGIGDGVTDHFLETYADHWVISTRTGQIYPQLKAWLMAQNRTVYWKQLHQSQKTSPSHFAGDLMNEPFLAREHGVNYQISFQAGYSQGIFLDQRENRQQVRKLCTESTTVLNTFAYTGAFSVCAALGGATTTTLDLSQPYLDWAKENFHANQLDPSQHYFCKGDTFHWLKRFSRQGRRFDGIILDPPTFSRDQKGKVFRAEKDYHSLVDLAIQCLAPHGWILASTNCHKMNLHEFQAEALKTTRRAVQVTTNSMPEEYTGEQYLKSLWLRPS